MNIFDRAKSAAQKTETKVDDKAVSFVRGIWNDTKFVVVHKTWGALTCALIGFLIGVAI